MKQDLPTCDLYIRQDFFVDLFNKQNSDLDSNVGFSNLQEKIFAGSFNWLQRVTRRNVKGGVGEKMGWRERMEKRRLLEREM